MNVMLTDSERFFLEKAIDRRVYDCQRKLKNAKIKNNPVMADGIAKDLAAYTQLAITLAEKLGLELRRI